MPIVELTDDELMRAAQAARALAYRHEQQSQDGNSAAAPHLDQARRYRALARHFEEARGGVFGR